MVLLDADKPWRRQQNVEMATALKAAGTRVEIVKIPPRTHKLIHFLDGRSSSQ